MTPRSLRSQSSAALPVFFVALMLLAVSLPAYGEMIISEAKTTCIASVPYPMIEAKVDPVPQEARVYFRAGEGSDFYYIQMAGGDGSYQGVLPVPSTETSQVVYYVEAISADADASRTEEFEAKVVDEGECGGRLYAGIDPQIAIFSTVDGAAAVPQGFLQSGVASTVSAAGVTTAVAPVGGAVAAAGGLGAGAITGIVAGGAAAGAVIVDELDDDDDEAASPSDP